MFNGLYSVIRVDVLETFSLKPSGLEILIAPATNSTEPWNDKMQ